MGSGIDADRAVAAAMGKEVEGEEDDGWEQDEELEEMVAAINLGNTTTTHSFAATAEWREMKAGQKKTDERAKGTEEWQKKKDKEDESRDQAQAKFAGQLASMRSENTTMMDAVLKKLDAIEQQGQGGRKSYREQTPQEQGPCGHGRPNCTETEEKAAELKEAYYGRAQQPAPSSLTNLLAVLTQWPTLTRNASIRLGAQERTAAGTSCDWTAEISMHSAQGPAGTENTPT